MVDNVSVNAPLIEWGLGRFQRYFVHPLLMKVDEDYKNEKVYRNGEQLRFGVEIFPAFSSESTLGSFFEDFKTFGSKICLHYELVDEKSGLLVQECIDSDHPPELHFFEDGVKMLCTTAVKVPDRYLGRELSFIITLSVSWTRSYLGKDDIVGDDEYELRNLIEKQKLRIPRIAPRIFSKEIVLIQVLSLTSAFDSCTFGAERSSLLIISAENNHPTRDLIVKDLIIHLGNTTNDHNSKPQCWGDNFVPHFDTIGSGINGAADLSSTGNCSSLLLLKQRFEVEGDKLFSLRPVWTGNAPGLEDDGGDTVPLPSTFPVCIQPGEVFRFSFVVTARQSQPSPEISAGHFTSSYSVSWFDTYASSTRGVECESEGSLGMWARDSITTSSSISWSFDSNRLQSSRYFPAAMDTSKSYPLELTLSAPDIVVVGRTFTITVTLFNSSAATNHHRTSGVGPSGSSSSPSSSSSSSSGALRELYLGVQDAWHSESTEPGTPAFKQAVPETEHSVETDVRYVCLDSETHIGDLRAGEVVQVSLRVLPLNAGRLVFRGLYYRKCGDRGVSSLPHSTTITVTNGSPTAMQ